MTDSRIYCHSTSRFVQQENDACKEGLEAQSQVACQVYGLSGYKRD